MPCWIGYPDQKRAFGMNDQETPTSSKKTLGFKSIALMSFIAALIVILGWWYLFGGGKQVLSDQAEPESTLVPAESLAPAAEAGAPVDQRLETLENLANSLTAAQTEQQALLESLQGLVRTEDLQASATRLREEIRAVRTSFPEAQELERSQLTLASHLLQLAEMEHRLLGNGKAVASLLERVGQLLSVNPSAIDLMVDLAKLEQEMRASQTPGVLEVSEELAAMGELVSKIPLRQSKYDPIPASSSGILERLGAGVRSLVRIERLESGDAQDEISRLQLLLGLERMQVALLRRDSAAFERQRTSMVAWVEDYAQTDHPDSQDMLARLAALQEIDLGVQAVDFASLLTRVGALAE